MPDTNCEYCHKPWTGHKFGHIIQAGCPLEEIDSLRSALAASKKREEELGEQIKVLDKLLEERNKILADNPCPDHGPCVPFVQQKFQAKDAEIAGLKETLFKYGVHMSGCVPSYTCSCGFKEALSKSPSASLEEFKAQIRMEALEEFKEKASALHVDIDPACDHENGRPGAGAMRAIIEYRDQIRALSPAPGEKAGGEA